MQTKFGGSRLLNFIWAFALAFVSSARSSEDIPGLLRVVLPGRLATQIAQDALGKPTAWQDQSHVTIPIKNNIEATLKKVDLTTAPEIVQVYGNRLFGLNFAQPFQLDLKIFGLVSQGDVKIRSLKFTPTSRENRILIDAELEIRRVRVSAREIWFRERGLTPEKKNNAQQVCPVPPNPIDSYRGNRVGARVLKPVVAPKSSALGDVPVIAHGQFEAEIIPSRDRRIEVRPLAVEHDVTRVLSANYELRAQLEVPPIFVKIDGECFPGDDKGIRALFKSMLEEIKLKVVSGVEETLVQVAMKASAEAFETLRLPIEHQITHRSKPEVLELSPDYRARVDATRVERRIYWAPIAGATNPTIEDWSQESESEELTIPDRTQAPAAFQGPNTVMASDATRVDRSNRSSISIQSSSGQSGRSLLQRFLQEVQGKLSLGEIDASRSGALILRLADELAINSVREPSLGAVSEGTLPKQQASQLRLILNRSFFESKADLVAALIAERESLLPKGIRLGQQGIEVLGTGGNRVSLVAHIEVELAAIEGWMGTAASLIEKYTGKTDGIYRIPLQLDLVPQIETVLNTRRLMLYFAVRENLDETEFGHESNLKDASRLRDIVVSQLKAAAEKLKKRPLMVDLSPLESQSPFRLERFEITERGALVIDLGLEGTREWFQKAKDRKKAKK